MAAISHESPSGFEEDKKGLEKILISLLYRPSTKKMPPMRSALRVFSCINEVIVCIWYVSCCYRPLVFEGPTVGFTYTLGQIQAGYAIEGKNTETV